MPARATFLAVLTTLLVPTAAHAASCRIPGGRGIDSNRIARLVAIPTPEGEQALFACIRRTGRKVLLDDSYSDARLAGRWVAWQRSGRPGHWRIAVHDLRTGKERLVDGHVAENSLRLTIRGSVVWAELIESQTETPLFANEVKSGGRLLDGGNVDPESVGLRGRRVIWTRDGTHYSTYVR